MVKNPFTEASIDRVMAEIRELAYSGLKGQITFHFDGKRFVKVDKLIVKPLVE